MKIFKKIIALLLLAMTCSFADWTGSTSEPASMKKIDGKAFYVITTADELAWFAAQVNSGKNDINAVLGNDIVFGKDKNTTGTVNWTPIGKTTDRQFAGILDGAGYTVYGLYSSGGTNAGLVGVLAETGIVKNIFMSKGIIKADQYAGAIVAINYGLVQNSENQNSVLDTNFTSYSGGIAGINKGVIGNCRNSGVIRGKLYSGGIAGDNTGTIQSCYNQGTVFSKNSTSSRTIFTIATTSYSGGIAGYNSGTISSCYNIAKIESSAKSEARISASGKITTKANAYSGGIVGFNAGAVFKCYNKANVSSGATSIAESGESSCSLTGGSGISPITTSYSYSGGIGGYNNGRIYDCYSTDKEYSSASRTEIYYYYYDKYSDPHAYGDAKSECKVSKRANIDGVSYKGGIVGLNAGNTKNSYYSTVYWLNNTTVTGSAENMQKDQFAWILNTCNGTEKNSGVWTRSSDGYPTFANEDSLAIYKIVFNDDGISSVRYTNYQGLVSFPDNPEPAEGYIFSGWFNSEEVKVKPSTIWTADETVNAAYTDASDVYWTINFINADGTLLETKSLQHGSIVEYKGDEPSLASTAQYDYTFKGWDVEPTNATENFDYHAVYDSTIRSYTIIFKDYDGSVIQSSSFLYGKTPTCTLVPKRSSTEEFNYSHSGWTPAVEKVTGEATYTAIYEATKVKYTVTFMNGSTVIEEQLVDYGCAAIAPSAPTRDGYKFVGWNVSFTNVTKNLTVKALFEDLVYHMVVVVIDKEKNSKNVEENDIFELPVAPEKDGYTFEGWYDADGKFVGSPGDKITVTEDLTLEAKYTVISYTITFANENGSEISSEKVAYGQMPTAPKDPTKASTAQYTYSFKGWNPTIVSVTGAATYTAVFDSTLRKYTVSFKNGSTTLQTSDVAYGSKPSYTGTTPTKTSTEKYTYSFKGWNPTITSVTETATYTAVFDSTLRKYTVSFKNDSTTLQTNDVAYGTTPSYTGITPTKESTDKYTYTFKGWSPSLASVTGAATYTATFDSTLRKYTITFKNGTATLQTSDVAYGSKPSYTGNAPTKSSTDKYSYTFKGWSPTLASVTGVATYTAVFDSTLRKYTITFKNGSTTLQTSEVAYGTKPSYTGSTPTKKATDKYTYEFKGWNPAIATVTKAATYQAVFDSSKVTGIIEGRLASSGVAVRVVSRSVQISAAPKNSTYAILDMQGRVLLSGRVESENFNIAMSRTGSYLVRVGNATRKVQVK